MNGGRQWCAATHVSMKHCSTILHGLKMVLLPVGPKRVSADMKPDLLMGYPVE
jgi:hypothetical protein